MNIKKIFNKPSGFTLVELMVVVGIIGILAAVAIPNFRKYQARSKTAEATLNLAQLYTSEATMKLNFNSYLTCVFVIGVAPVPKGYYVVGFSNAVNVIKTGVGVGPSNMITPIANCEASATPQVVNVGTNNVSSSTDSFTVPTVYMSVSGSVVADTDMTDTSIDANTSSTLFTAEAVGSVSSSTSFDKWTINEAKQIKQIQRGF